VLRAPDPPLPTDPKALQARFDALRPRLLLFAIKHVAEPMDPAEMVHTAVQSAMSAVLTGKGRHWPREKCPSLLTFMLNAVSSVISHEFEKTYTELRAGSIHQEDGPDLEPPPPSASAPDDVLRKSRRLKRGYARIDAVEARLDPLALPLRVFRGMQDGTYDATDLAVACDVDVADIYRARPRDHQIRPDDTPAPSSAPSSAPRAPDQQEADRVRLIALQACTAETWGACKEGLDRARALDPAGETDPRVVAARKALASAAQHDKTPR